MNKSIWISYEEISIYQDILPIITLACNVNIVSCDGSFTPTLQFNNTSNKLYMGVWGATARESSTGGAYFVFTGNARLNVHTIFIDSDYSHITQQRPAL